VLDTFLQSLWSVLRSRFCRLQLSKLERRGTLGRGVKCTFKSQTVLIGFWTRWNLKKNNIMNIWRGSPCRVYASEMARLQSINSGWFNGGGQTFNHYLLRSKNDKRWLKFYSTSSRSRTSFSICFHQSNWSETSRSIIPGNFKWLQILVLAHAFVATKKRKIFSQWFFIIVVAV